ncbi:hypothetical protein E2C01_000733 [Portunus trituberculatus]|uniref:Uncharacterized protein n=1 Tax=Portunus trituberculatus TaxID=210409 RepID=A0A5B7CFY4_PORTR|nr:hypothetical protein [Portunus trituberculatus]
MVKVQLEYLSQRTEGKVIILGPAGYVKYKSKIERFPEIKSGSSVPFTSVGVVNPSGSAQPNLASVFGSALLAPRPPARRPIMAAPPTASDFYQQLLPSRVTHCSLTSIKSGDALGGVLVCLHGADLHNHTCIVQIEASPTPRGPVVVVRYCCVLLPGHRGGVEFPRHTGHVPNW